MHSDVDPSCTASTPKVTGCLSKPSWRNRKVSTNSEREDLLQPLVGWCWGVSTSTAPINKASNQNEQFLESWPKLHMITSSLGPPTVASALDLCSLCFLSYLGCLWHPCFLPSLDSLLSWMAASRSKRIIAALWIPNGKWIPAHTTLSQQFMPVTASRLVTNDVVFSASQHRACSAMGWGNSYCDASQLPSSLIACRIHFIDQS